MPPRPAAAPLPARLRINAWPYAEVRLEGGRALGTTPLRDVEVPSGRQVLLFENPELGLEQRVELELKPGEQRTVGIRLDR